MPRLERFSLARLEELSWVQRTLLVGLVLSVLWSAWQVPRGNLTMRALRDTVVFIALPAALAITHGRHLGWRVDRRALRNAVLIALFVLPFYLVGSSLPSIRAYYPMWETSTALSAFLSRRGVTVP